MRKTKIIHGMLYLLYLRYLLYLLYLQTNLILFHLFIWISYLINWFATILLKKRTPTKLTPLAWFCAISRRGGKIPTDWRGTWARQGAFLAPCLPLCAPPFEACARACPTWPPNNRRRHGTNRSTRATRARAPPSSPVPERRRGTRQNRLRPYQSTSNSGYS